MRVGYGRGYYGNGQLAPSAPRPRTSWFKVIAVVGFGAAIVWMLLPRDTSSGQPLTGGGGGGKPPDPPRPPDPSLPPAVGVSAPAAVAVPTTALLSSSPSPPASATGAFLKQLEDDARDRNFVSVNDYEDSVIATAKQLQAAGAKVVLAPHLEHLTPRLQP